MTHRAYTLLAIDTVVRITLSLALLYVVVPRLALPRERGTGVLERLWWNFAFVTLVLVFGGEILSVGNLYTLPSVLFVILAIAIVLRARRSGETVARFIQSRFDIAVIATFNVLDGRVNFGRRMRLRLRRWVRRARRSVFNRRSAPAAAGWVALTAVAAGLRFYRPFLSLDLGASDPYVHLYWLKMLELGKQVDLSWGPYPRGLHFVLLAIVKLANVDEVLLVNFFGAFMGVLLVLSVADVTRRLSRSKRAGLLAGFLFATMIGGASQAWIIGGSFAGQTVDTLPHRTIGGNTFLTRAEPGTSFDLMFPAFKRETITLPQEMAVVVLFPTAMFALDYIRKRRRWDLAGYLAGVAAIAAIHPGVLVPLGILMVAVTVATVTAGRSRGGAVLFRGTLAAIAAGSSWLVVFVAYDRNVLSHFTGEKDLSYFLPFLGRSGGPPRTPVFTTTTPLMIGAALAAVILFASTFFVRRRALVLGLRFIAAAALLTIGVQIAPSLAMPQLLEPSRNSLWLMMTLASILAIAIDWLSRLVRAVLRVPALACVIVVLALWWARVPDLRASELKNDEFVNATEYGSAAAAVVGIERRLQPFTWTVVTYGQEFPHVLGRGYHLPAAEFLEKYDPGAPALAIPTPYVFVIVEKRPHEFQVHAWAASFSRTNLEERLAAWCVLYQSSHRDMRVYQDDEDVRIYVIQRS